MKLLISSDHAAYDLKVVLKPWLEAQGHQVTLLGATSTDAYDYPDASDAIAHGLNNDPDAMGILMCGSGIGVSIRANRYKHIRAALCCGPTQAALARQHNHANVICIGARMMDDEEAKRTIDVFLNTEEDHDPRHERRTAKLAAATD
jgi:ribose 5-phosphate isomerase B